MPTPPPELRLKVGFQTLGCKVNLYDTHAMQASLGQEVLLSPPDEADVLVVNSCAVTAQAWAEARKLVRRYKRNRPDGRVVVTGCFAQIQPEVTQSLEGVDVVLGTRDRGKLTEVLQQFQSQIPPEILQVSNVMADRVVEDLSTGMSFGRTRGTLRVQTGCNYRCSFCVIPYARGNSVSVPLETVLEEANRLIAAGHSELVPVGIHVADYGKDLRPRLGLMDLLSALLELPGLHRLRLSSIDPHEVDEELLELVAQHPKMARYLHIAVQSMSESVLKAMKRRHGAAEFTQMVTMGLALNPRMAFGTDILTGFPTETEEQAQETLQGLEALDLAYCHVFPYSPRPGTPAADLKPLPSKVVTGRAQALRDLSETKKSLFLNKLLGHTLEIVTEPPKNADLPWGGLSSEYAKVSFTGPQPFARGQVVNAKALQVLETGKLLVEMIP